MRGTHATIAAELGVTSHTVAAALGHESVSTTYRSYARLEAVSAARQNLGVDRLGTARREPPYCSGVRAAARAQGAFAQCAG